MKKPGQLTAMISSTALDLPEHRERVFDACLREGVFPIGMEHLPARDASGIRVSLEMVDQADVYIGIYAWRYGWVPDFDNPGKISITEMELNRAIERTERGELKEILVFLMHDDHPIRAKDKEDGAQRKLKAFKKRASNGRGMLQFKSKEELHGQVIHSLADLKHRIAPDPSADVEKVITDPRHWDKLHNSNIPFDHRSFPRGEALSQVRMKDFQSRPRVVRQRDFLPGLTTLDLFRQFKFIESNGNICNGAFLCFGNAPSDSITGATTKCFSWKGITEDAGIDDDLESRGGLLDQFEEAVGFLVRTLRLGRTITDIGRTDELEIPIKVIEEIVANALVHRDYEAANGSVHISVYDDRIEVANPGLLMPPLELAKLSEINISVPRNPQIARIFYLAGFVERAAKGIKRVHASLAEKGLPAPEFREGADKTFVVVLRRPVGRKFQPAQAAVEEASATSNFRLPTPPAFYAEPDYIGSHQFVGREAEMQALNDWAAKADPTNLLLFEAIGGNGKSMLTWEWTTRHSTIARSDWAGRFWYSFYEKGAVMADFCRRALAYMTKRPLEDFAKKKTPELKDELLRQLHVRPWLLILDGLERVLVAYHRIDAAEVPDEEANTPTDPIANRDPRDAIRDEDNDLLRSLAAATPSKILVSSRLTPRVLLNQAGQPIPGARRITLPGLRPPDAEKLLRSSGIEGASAAIQSYLTAKCDNHPLVIGILAGLINQPGPNRGNFDKWVDDPRGGAALDLGLDLIQRRNHILHASLEALSPESRQLLSTLALLSDSVDYETLKAFNPHLPPEAKKLEATVTDLEQRGLLQWDGRERKYNLHPVVRGVASGGMAFAERERYGERVVDHFSAQPHRPYEEAETLEDLESGLHIVRTLLKLGHFQQAANAYQGDLSSALLFNLEAYSETLSLLRPFFPGGWDELPKEVIADDGVYLANDAAIALGYCDQSSAALAAYGAALRAVLPEESWVAAATHLRNISGNLSGQNRLAQAFRINASALEVATVSENEESIFMGRLRLFGDQSRLGRWTEAAATWQLLDPMGRTWSRAAYRPGTAESDFARFHLWRGTLQEKHLAEAEHLAVLGKDRSLVRILHSLRGTWRLEQDEWALAAASYQEAVLLARERGLSDAASETGLALAKHHLGQLAEPQQEAERLAELRDPAHRLLAQLWLALGDSERATRHALAAYKWTWADGEPYVNRYELTKTTELLQQMKVEIPTLPPYDPAKEEPLPWEPEVRAAIEQLKARSKQRGKAKGKKPAEPRRYLSA